MTYAQKSVLLVSGLMVLLLGGCISRREMAARHYETCRAFGFTPGTDYFGGCMLQLEMADHGYGHHGAPNLRTGQYPPSTALPTPPPAVPPPR